MEDRVELVGRKHSWSLQAFIKKGAGKLITAVRNQDRFGQSVALNFEGNETYRTVPGGILSMLFLLIMFGYSVMRAESMINKRDWTITQQTVVASLESLQAERSFNQLTNISMAIQVFPKRPRIDENFRDDYNLIKVKD
jgi:hypothetical protein